MIKILKVVYNTLLYFILLPIAYIIVMMQLIGKAGDRAEDFLIKCAAKLSGDDQEV